MFWDLDQTASPGPVLHDSAGKTPVGRDELLALIERFEAAFHSSEKILVALFCDNSVASVAAYLAALRSRQAVMLVNNSTDVSLKRRLCEVYSPEIIASTDPSFGPSADGQSTEIGGLGVTVCPRESFPPIFPETALLLSTSGTTGSPKLVRLSSRNLQSNAEASPNYLETTRQDRAITTLPISYSYGLSVLNSHLAAGASVVCTNSSLVTKEFWQAFTSLGCTSFAGVPFSYAMLERLRFERMALPSLRTMTQAGGRLAPEKIKLFSELGNQKNFRFFVMYGQTEATARISYVPWEGADRKIGSIGIAIPGGSLRVMNDGVETSAPNSEGELVYRGPNVMLGYAESREDLAKGDELGGELRTGDLGFRDEDGYFYVTGRLKRFIKIVGLRLNLDEIEKMLESALGRPVACAGEDERLDVWVESESENDAVTAQKHVVSLYGLHHTTVKVRCTAALPLNQSGKLDYARISSELR